MTAREIEIPFGPDKTGGLGLKALSPEGSHDLIDPLADPHAMTRQQPVDLNAIPQVVDTYADLQVEDTGVARAELDQYAMQALDSLDGDEAGEAEADVAADDAEEEGEDKGRRRKRRGEDKSEESQIANGMDEMQRSIAALRDSIGQGRELKAREKEREELAEALAADHEELADRENILANYFALVAEQDAIVNDRTQQRDERKAELARVTAQADQLQGQLDEMREQYSLRMQPLENDLGRAKAAADQAKNDERSRRTELNAAEAELRRASEDDGNTMAMARRQQVDAAYSEARKRSEEAKERLAQVQKAHDDAKEEAKQAMAPLERNLDDLNKQTESLKDAVSSLGEEISAARKRRQYCDTVYQYPDETAKMREEVEAAEEVARQMDAENDELREQLALSKQRARKAKIAIAVVIVLIIVIIAAFVIVSTR